MRHFILGALALVLLAGCATPPPPEPGSAASKIVVMGKFKGIAVAPSVLPARTASSPPRCN